mgnify:CR=1 FL=1
MFDSKMIASNIKMYRENCGYTQQQVADVLNMDRSTYAYYELGKIVPSIGTIFALAQIFHVDYSILLGMEDYDTKKLREPSIKKKYHSEKNSLSIYELSKSEKNLLAYFRLLDAREQEEIFQVLNDKVRSKKRK